MEGDGGGGGINERGEKGGPSVKRRGIKVIFLSFAERGGGVSSPYGWGQGAGFVPYPEGLVRPGKRGTKGGIFMGGREEKKVNKK